MGPVWSLCLGEEGRDHFSAPQLFSFSALLRKPFAIFPTSPTITWKREMQMLRDRAVVPPEFLGVRLEE